MMNKLELMVQEFESLNTEEQESLKGGFATTTLQENDERDIVINIYQCGCSQSDPKGQVKN